MKFNKTNFALAAGFTGAVFSFIDLLGRLMFWGGMMRMMPMKKMLPMKGMMLKGMLGWGMIIAPLLAFLGAAAAGWLFAFFYNKLGDK